MNQNFETMSPIDLFDSFDDDNKFFYHDGRKGITFVGAGLTTDEVCLKYRISINTFDGNDGTGIWDNFKVEDIVYKHQHIYKNFQFSNDYKEDFKPLELSLVHDNHRNFNMTFKKAKDTLRNTSLKKVVISRAATYVCKRPIKFGEVLNQLILLNPGSYVFAFHKKGKMFFGATPELLVEKQATEIHTMALAGTIKRSGQSDPQERELLLSDQKNRYEHRLVVDSIVEDLEHSDCSPELSSLEVLTLKNVHHLQTQVKCSNSRIGLKQWAAILHPTPAIGGVPKKEAQNFINTHEMNNRGLYAAPIGIFDQYGNGQYIVGIRSALWTQNELTVFAGCGIVPDSDFDSEWLESENKMETILESVNPGGLIAKRS